MVPKGCEFKNCRKCGEMIFRHMSRKSDTWYHEKDGSLHHAKCVTLGVIKGSKKPPKQAQPALDLF